MAPKTPTPAMVDIATPGTMLEDMKFIWEISQLVDFEIPINITGTAVKLGWLTDESVRKRFQRLRAKYPSMQFHATISEKKGGLEKTVKSTPSDIDIVAGAPSIAQRKSKKRERASADEEVQVKDEGESKPAKKKKMAKSAAPKGPDAEVQIKDEVKDKPIEKQNTAKSAAPKASDAKVKDEDEAAPAAPAAPVAPEAATTVEVDKNETAASEGEGNNETVESEGAGKDD